MTFGEIFSPLTALFRVVLSIFWRGSNHFNRRLEARLLMRGIVSEMPKDFPFYICDESGTHHNGVYVIGLLIWNRGNQPITKADLIASSPLEVKIGVDANIVKACAIPVEDLIVFDTTVNNKNTLSITFDCLNPNEYLVVSIFVTGNPMTEVQVTGRIVGQENPIDHTALEVRAPIGERFSTLFILGLIVNAIPGFLIGGSLILKGYGLSTLWNNPDAIPKYLMLPFGMGTMVLFMFLFSRLINWNERRQFPEGYPLYADLEPPLLENVRGMIRTVFQGKKQRVSVSLFNWGKPILMSSKKIRRRTVDDWIE
ncbi:MAG: hypothetical protein K2Y28_07110 [Burkholderiaceae bacterium]|nr:hypothetical protein [Burkholderiaceae bacterium]